MDEFFLKKTKQNFCIWHCLCQKLYQTLSGQEDIKTKHPCTGAKLHTQTTGFICC